MTEPGPLTQQREELARVLASPLFQSSRQTRDFLQYVSERVFSGAGDLDQAEIARDVLGRQDFDPTTDASVRKLATSVRQRLEKYYEGPGAADEVVIKLPLRSYAPTFELRPPASVSAVGLARSRAVWPVVLAGVCVMGAVGGLAWNRMRPEPPAPHLIRIMTERGDLTRPAPDPAPGAMRLGTALGLSDSIAAEVTFRPEHEGQHAGLIVWQGPDRYVALGRRFTSRNYLTFGYQFDAYFTVPAGNDVFDAEGQSGRPVWLRLVRSGDTFRAWSSLDGSVWTRVGGDLQVALSPGARAGVFAVNGRRPSPSIPAEFRLAGKGPVLNGIDAEAATLDTWKFSSSCPGGANLLDVPPNAASWPQCQAVWSRNLAPAQLPVFSATTRIDVISSPAMAVGVFVSGSSGRLRVVRYHGESPSIALIHDGRFLQPTPDYPGSPPVYLRLRGSESGVVVAECSVDGRTFRTVGNPVPLALLGKLDSFGLVAAKRAPVTERVPTLRFFFVQEDLFPLEQIRFPRR